MFVAIGTFVTRRAKLVLAGSSLLLVAAIALGMGAFGVLKTSGAAFQDPSAQSTTVQQLLDRSFGGSNSVVLVVHPTTGGVDSPAATRAGAAAARRLASTPEVTGVVSYWSTHNPGMRSADGKYALVVGNLPADETVSTQELSRLRDSGSPAIQIDAGGGAVIGTDVNTQVGKSLALAEGVAVPIVLILLVFAFGSVVSALLPLAIGLIAIMGTFAELFLLGSITDVAIYAINLTTALGLALAIDYALLIVSRFREELAEGQAPPDAVVRSVATAGRTVVFSGATVMAALAMLLIFPMYFLRSFAYAGIGVVLISMLAAVIVLPAMLTLLGTRVNSGRLPWARAKAPSTVAPAWGRLAGVVMRRTALIAVPVIAVLLLFAAPLAHISFGSPDDRVLRSDTQSRTVGDLLRTHFNGDASNAVDVVADGALPKTAVTDYATALSKLPSVEQVETSAGVFVHGAATPDSANPNLGRPDAQRFTVVTTADPRSETAQKLVAAVRHTAGPSGVTTYVGGTTAQLVDTKDAIGSRLPLAILIVVLTTFVVLFGFTGSVLQPIRSLLLNTLTLSATVGLMVWVFQDGHLSGLLDFAPLPLDISMVVLLFCIAFGLSMDYEVIVLSRIKELHDHGADNVTSVTDGLSHSGRIVTTAAALIAVSFFAFGLSTVSFLQLFGIGAGVAVLIDATLVRAILVPACQQWLGRLAWWAPRPMRALHERIGLAETDLPAATQDPVEETADV